MIPTKAVSGLAKGVAEEAADAAVPCLDPRHHTLAISQLLLELVNMCHHGLLVNDPFSRLGVEAQETDLDGAGGQCPGDGRVSLGRSRKIDRPGLGLVEIEAKDFGKGFHAGPCL